MENSSEKYVPSPLLAHAELNFVQALLLCFKLQESRIAVVSSTAAATLRQLVMFVVDKVVDEARRDDLEGQDLSDITLPNGTTKTLGPSARDAFSVFEDLCLLANAEKPTFLKLEFLRKTFALELIESVLTNYHDLFRKVSDISPAALTTTEYVCSIQNLSCSYNTIYVPYCSRRYRTGQASLLPCDRLGLFSYYSNSSPSSLEPRQKSS